MTNRMSEHRSTENLLGTYLRDRRTKLDPAAFTMDVVRDAPGPRGGQVLLVTAIVGRIPSIRDEASPTGTIQVNP